ncbi:MAG: hypothetical protein AAFP03_02040 [Cyanobacteria bacterium J06598_3]
MQPANKSKSSKIKAYSRFLLLASLLLASVPTAAVSRTVKPVLSAKPQLPSALTKTEAQQGEFIGPAVDCDGDGLVNDSRIDFDGDGTGDECVESPADIPEPPFEQTYTPTSDSFYGSLPAVGWRAQYQCGDALGEEGFEVTLRRPSEDTLEYAAEGLTLSSPIVYDDIDPNLNQPLIVQDPTDGVRYSFQQQRGGEFYEYAIANYNGNIGLYVYQTGEQVVAAPCSSVSSATANVSS